MKGQEYDTPEHLARLCPELTDKFCDTVGTDVGSTTFQKLAKSKQHRERKGLKFSKMVFLLLCSSDFSNKMLFYHVPIAGNRQQHL